MTGRGGLAAGEQALAKHMLEISGRCYPGGPREHLEYALWYALIHGPMTYGRAGITAADIDRLRAMSRACGHWIRFDQDPAGTAVPLAEWQDLFSRNFDMVQLDG